MDWNRPIYEQQCESDWNTFPEQTETSNWNEPIQEPPQQGFASPLPRTARSLRPIEPTLTILTPHELEQQNFNNRWETVHFVFQGWNTPPYKTKKQNPKYHNEF